MIKYFAVVPELLGELVLERGALLRVVDLQVEVHTKHYIKLTAGKTFTFT